jgi:hypothetical protein
MESEFSLWSLRESSGRARVALVAGFITAVMLYLGGVGVEPVATVTGIEYRPLNYAFISTVVSVGIAKILTPATSVESTLN